LITMICGCDILWVSLIVQKPAPSLS